MPSATARREQRHHSAVRTNAEEIGPFVIGQQQSSGGHLRRGSWSSVGRDLRTSRRCPPAAEPDPYPIRTGLKTVGVYKALPRLVAGRMSPGLLAVVHRALARQQLQAALRPRRRLSLQPREQIKAVSLVGMGADEVNELIVRRIGPRARRTARHHFERQARTGYR